MKEGLVFGAFVTTLVVTLLSTLLKLNIKPVFWLEYLSIVTLLFVIVVFCKRYRLASLILFDVFVFLLFTLQYPAIYQVDRDTGFETEYTKEVIKTRYWDPKLGTGYSQDYYGYTPVLHLVMASASLVTGIGVDIIAKFFAILIFRIFFLILSVKIFQLMLNDKYNGISYLAGLIFVITPRLRVEYISRRLIAAILILTYIYALLKSRGSSNKLNWNILLFVLSIMIILADHTLALLFGGLLLGYFVWEIAFARGREEKVMAGVRFCLYGIAWFLWTINIAIKTVAVDLRYFTSLTGTGQTSNFAAQANSALAKNIMYSSLEQRIMMISQIVLLSIALAVFGYLFFKQGVLRRFFNHNELLVYLGLVSFPAAFLLTYMLGTKYVVIANITLWLFLIVPCLCLGLLIYHLKQSAIGAIAALILVLLIFAGGILLNYHTNVLYSDTRMLLVELPEYKNSQIFESAKWLEGYSHGKGTVIADRSVFDIYSAYFGFEISPVEIAQKLYQASQQEMEKNFLSRDIYFGAYASTAIITKPRFIVVNRDLLTNPSYYLEVTSAELEKFDKSKMLKNIYDNGQIVIYENLG